MRRASSGLQGKHPLHIPGHGHERPLASAFDRDHARAAPQNRRKIRARGGKPDRLVESIVGVETIKAMAVSTMDVGRAAAWLMGEDWTGTRITELSGPEDWSASDMALAFADVIGRPVEPAFVPPEQRPAFLAEAGIPEEVATALPGTYEAIANGRLACQPGTEHCRGTTSLTAAVEGIVAKAKTGI